MFELSSIRARPDRPAELRASAEAFPDQGPDEGDGGEIDLPGFKTPTNLGEKERREEEEDDRKSSARPPEGLSE